MKSKEELVRKKILSNLSQLKKPISKRELARKMKISPATTSKYVDILKAEGKICVEHFGNINLISILKNGEKD